MKLKLPNSCKGRILFSLLVLAVLCAIDGFLIEPNWIEVTHHFLTVPVAQPLKIAHLSDLHTERLGLRERRLLKLLDQEKPDVIVITGDTISSTGTYEEEARVLRELHAPLGVWLVRGNWENWYALRNESDFYRANGIHFLLNRRLNSVPTSGSPASITRTTQHRTSSAPLQMFQRTPTASRCSTARRSSRNPRSGTTWRWPGIRMVDRSGFLFGDRCGYPRVWARTFTVGLHLAVRECM
jgi:predicted MPP superfamily phosphohydrolase